MHHFFSVPRRSEGFETRSGGLGSPFHARVARVHDDDLLDSTISNSSTPPVRHILSSSQRQAKTAYITITPKMKHSGALLAAMLSVTSAVKDGNPRLWDRVRRCDDDYGINPDLRNPYDTEPCKLCEGIGGEVWGDSLDAFVPTSCVPLADNTEVLPVGPAKWGGQFSVELDEIMINECDDSGMCNFPGDDSIPNHAYVRQGGVWHMDFRRDNRTNEADEPRRILIEYDFAFPATVPPIAIQNEGRNDVFHYPGRPVPGLPREMFVVTYDAVPVIGDLCICIGLSLAGPITPDHMLPDPSDITSIPTTYPVRFLGRELLGIEYWGPNRTMTEMVVDHWIKGPHHIWVNAEEGSEHYGQIVRGWQPWNALQLFQNYKPLETRAVQKLNASPTAIRACNRPPFPGIGCDRETVAVNREADEELRSMAAEKVPREAYKGENFEDMANTLNIHLKELLVGTVGHGDCSDFTNEELNDVMHLVHAVRDPSLNEIYTTVNDPRSLKHHDNIDLSARFEKEAQLLVDAPHLEPMLRDGKCHEIVMWFIHHLSRESQTEVSEMIALPYLPAVRHHVAPLTNGAESRLGQQYLEAIQCTDCHLKYTPEYITSVFNY